ncbi:MFS transporter [Nocardiopsis sp. LDBS1602]|uniref:MFS transporter n=1 Tax=Nocardiopsis sp. LDBS1602 TaxID=3109597 RepID=UPI002DB9C047|nr:MFS transporter [Nocardiopsis sp. LDBS1602]MEC3890994.1 MFS transporter [Nocardiopsis sp. LDBS1602]
MSSTVSTTAVDDSRTTPRRWAAVAVLSLSTFLVVTSEMLPIGVLTPMAEGLGISTGATGSSLTVTGLVAAVTAPLVPRLLGGLDRRAVLAVAMVVLALGNALTALASGFAFMVLSRVILGLAMGTVWGMAAAVTTRLVAPRDVALSVSFVIGGVAAASVAGVPLGTMVGDSLGWRAAFTALAVAALVLAAALTVALPRLPRPAASAGDDGPAPALLTPAVAIGLAMVALLVTAHFAAYTYVRPVLEEHSGLAPTAIAPLLLVYGLFGLAGNFLAGATAARRSRLTILTLAGGIALAVALSALSGQTSWVAWVWIALWGAAYGGVSVAGQLWMTRAVPHRVEQIAGLYVGVFTASIALGALLGGVVVEAAGLVLLLWSAAALALVSLLVGVFGPRR